jgi:hypothetical protein
MITEKELFDVYCHKGFSGILEEFNKLKEQLSIAKDELKKIEEQGCDYTIYHPKVLPQLVVQGSKFGIFKEFNRLKEQTEELKRQLKTLNLRYREIISDSIDMWNHDGSCDCSRCTWVGIAKKALKEGE